MHFGLRPLSAVRAGVEAVRHGRSKKLDGSYPAEVTPLIGEVNDLLASQDASINFARARAADLAHGLKTPLSVLAATAPDLRARGDVATADLLEELSADMADRIDYQLRLSRLHQRQRSEVLNASLNDALQQSLAEIPDGPAESAGIGYGQAVAAAILAARAADHSSDSSDYMTTDEPGHWQPEPGSSQTALGPGWGNVDPFAIASTDDFAIPPPPAMDSAEYTAAFNQVKELGAADSAA